MKLLIPFLVVLALVGATGLSSMHGDDFCGSWPADFTQGVGAVTEIVVWPPGWRCVYDDLQGHQEYANAGSVPWFLVALAGQLGVGLWAVRRRTEPARLAAATTVALAAVGAGGLVGGYAFAFTFGCVVGVPLAWLTDVAFARAEGGPRSRRRSVTAALVAGLAVFATAVLASLWPAMVAAIVVVAGVALLARATVPAARPRPAR